MTKEKKEFWCYVYWPTMLMSALSICIIGLWATMSIIMLKMIGLTEVKAFILVLAVLWIGIGFVLDKMKGIIDERFKLIEPDYDWRYWLINATKPIAFFLWMFFLFAYFEEKYQIKKSEHQ
jgi:uncharacterized membrane protein